MTLATNLTTTEQAHDIVLPYRTLPIVTATKQVWQDSVRPDRTLPVVTATKQVWPDVVRSDRTGANSSRYEQVHTQLCVA